MKLHAVAPGGPPEGQCKKEHEMVCNTTFDDRFRTAKLAYRWDVDARRGRHAQTATRLPKPARPVK